MNSPVMINVKIDGDKLAEDMDQQCQEWLQSHIGDYITIKMNGVVDEAKLLPTIEPPALNKGELYAGIILGKNDERDHHLILLPGDKDDANWEEAKKWAKKQDGELPTRREQALLYANLKEEFKENWYWSCERHAADADCAWAQYFYYGSQDYNRKDYQLRARAVRRVPIFKDES